ncbi:MAG: hypothetical protein Q8R02_11790 [Hyphomonadaceae bacterium]|nr:hypothetical protein [Hyphomonadaceae bacterium]
MKRAVLAVFLGGSLALAAAAALPASAQEGAPQTQTPTPSPPVPDPTPTTPGTIVQTGDVEQVAPIDEVDRVVGLQRGPGFRAPEGVRVVRPGALLFASFDKNFDGKIGPAEIDAGAAGAFAVADRNGDGMISGFEQNDWAASMGGGADILSNPMTFDVDLDRSVSKAEFAIGIKRMASQVSTGDIAFSDLMKPLSSQEQRAESGGQGVLVGRAPGGGRGPNASARN